MKRKLKPYTVISWSGSWYVIKTHNKRMAYSHGVQEFGRGGVKNVVLATDADIESYKAQKGVSDIDKVEA